ncbi:tetratricopeptide repeat protein [Streptomyces sp. NPDC059917]|uniref:tetratricopeptide repeat protein n=1 Tax=Streptomyces sp. NPDC059917 TaxID=3347002 RepID=UPI003662C75A
MIFSNGRSLRAGGLHQDAHNHWASLTETAARVLGPDHPDTIKARADLVTAFYHLGRHHDALALLESVHADSERIHGPDHPNTLSARANLPATYRSLGRHNEAAQLRNKPAP